MTKVAEGVWVSLNDYIKIPNVPGVYVIRHLESGKCYVGKSVKVSYRLKRHMTLPDEGSYLHRALAKYGFDSFECCLHLTGTKEELSYYEIETIKDLNSLAPSGYNLTGGGEGMLGFKLSAEARAKISQSKLGKPMSEEVKRRMSEGSKGFKHTPESRAKIGAAHRGRKMPKEQLERLRQINTGKRWTEERLAKAKGRKLSESHRLAIAKAQKGKPCPGNRKQVLVWALDSFVPRVYESITALAEDYKVTITSASRWLTGEFMPSRGFTATVA